MNQRRHLTVVAAVATLLAAMPIEALFQQWAWLFDAFAVVALICGAALGARALRAPLWVQPIATSVTLLFGLTWLFADGHAFGGVIPSLATAREFRDLVSQAGADMQSMAVPVQSERPLLLLVVAGIGVCAVLVDFFAAGLRRPAIAGLPMLAIYVVPVEIDPHPVSFVPFVIGAMGFMWLLVTDNIDRVRMFGRRFTGDGRGVDMWEPSPLAAVGRRMAFAGLLLALIIPLMTPGLTSGLFGPYGHHGAGGSKPCSTIGCSGNSNSVNLFGDLAGRLNQSRPSLFATITTDDPKPEYLQFAVAGNLTAAGFKAEVPGGGALTSGIPSDPTVSGAGITYTKYHANVQVHDLDATFLPVYLQPVSGTFKNVPQSFNYDPSTEEIFSTNTSVKNLEYEFDYDHPDYDSKELAQAPALRPDDPIQEHFASVPADVKQVDDVIRTQTAGASNEYDTVLGLTKYFSRQNHFVYSLSTKTGTTGTDIGDFLQNRQGYCVQYASALAWLVRAAHYPARVAFGFAVGASSEPNVYQVTNLNLHAWTEVYFSGFGWVPFDVTPLDGVAGGIRTGWAPDPNAALAPGGTVPSKGATPSTGPGGAGASHRPTRPDGPDGPVTSKGSSLPLPLWSIVLLSVLALAGIGAMSPAVTRFALRGRRTESAAHVPGDGASPGQPWVVTDTVENDLGTRKRVHAAWDELIDTMIDFRVPVDPAETPLAASTRLSKAVTFSPEATGSIALIGASEQRARYARRPGAQVPLAEALKVIRRDLEHRVSLRTRLRARFLPPSVTQRWAADATMAMAHLSARNQERRERFLRSVNLRRWVSPRS